MSNFTVDFSKKSTIRLLSNIQSKTFVNNKNLYILSVVGEDDGEPFKKER